MWNPPSTEILSRAPRLRTTERVPLKEKLIHLHFFIGACDWYVAEFDGEVGQNSEKYARKVCISIFSLKKRRKSGFEKTRFSFTVAEREDSKLNKYRVEI